MSRTGAEVGANRDDIARTGSPSKPDIFFALTDEVKHLAEVIYRALEHPIAGVH